ncbi:hypothetical protein NMY22_g17951 [Coprinellus aureogranulatus]|nr:hypothetical protein NMY22_g17951 [Coprinellus aureogranulatus]
MPKRLIQHIQLALTALQIRYPGTTDATVYPALRLFHLSFIEYLQSPATPPEHSFPVPARQSHARQEIEFMALGETGNADLGDVADRLGVPETHLPRCFASLLLEIASRLQERNSSNWRELGWAHSMYAKDAFSEDHIDRAVNAHRRAVKVAAAEDDDDDEQSSCLYSLATALETRFRLQGRVRDFEESIHLPRSAVSLRPPGHPERILALNNLANALRADSIRRSFLPSWRNGLDLEETISLYREVLALRPPGHPNRAASLHSLAMFLDTRSVCVDTAADLEESISLKRESLTLRPEGHPDRWSSLNGLAYSLMSRFERHGIVVEDLEESVKVVRDALSLQPTGHPRRFCTLDTAALCLRFRREDVEE